MKHSAYIVSGQLLEEVHGPRKEVHDLFLGLIVDVAARLERRVACSMLAPLVFPEALICAILVLPVDIHILEYVLAARCLQNLRDVGVLPRFIAVLIVGAVAMVGPRDGILEVVEVVF